MSEGVFTRMSKKDKKKMEEDRKLKGIESQNEYMVKAVRHYRECDKSSPKLKGMKRIIAPIDYECFKCHKKGKKGDQVMYGTGGIMCPDCWVGRLGDKRTADLIMVKRELKYDNKALKNEKERRIQELMEIQYVMLIKDANEQDRRIIQHDLERNQRASELMQLNEQYIKQNFTKEEEKELFEKVSNLYELQVGDREDRFKEREELRARTDRANEIYRKFVILKKKKVNVKPVLV